MTCSSWRTVSLRGFLKGFETINQRSLKDSVKDSLKALSEEEHWLHLHDVHREARAQGAEGHERLYEDARQREERRFLRSQRKLAQEAASTDVMRTWFKDASRRGLRDLKMFFLV